MRHLVYYRNFTSYNYVNICKLLSIFSDINNVEWGLATSRSSYRERWSVMSFLALCQLLHSFCGVIKDGRYLWGQLQPAKGQLLAAPYYMCYYVWLHANPVCACCISRPHQTNISLYKVWLTLSWLMSSVYLVTATLCHRTCFIVIYLSCQLVRRAL